MIVGTAVAVLAALAGCSKPTEKPGLVLTLASPDRASDATGQHIQHLADEVARLSEGAIRIDPQWDVTPDDIPTHNWDQVVGARVANGTYDLGLVPGRAWDELGVTSLRALDTPFLINNSELLAAVLNSDLRQELVSGLSEAGVVGMDIFPDQFRHPFAYDDPLLGPEDYAGQVIRSPTSATIRAMLKAFGAAEVVDDIPAVENQRGQESAYALAGAGIATGNVVLLPKTETLVADEDVRRRLRDDQWDVLQRAAANTREWLVENLPSEVDEAATFCARGGQIVTASPSQLDDLQRAATPVIAWLRKDTQTRHLMDGIRQLARTHPEPDVITRCPDVPKTSGPTDQNAESALNGTYVARVTQRRLRDAGVTDLSGIQENSGSFTWTLHDGTYTYHQAADHFISRTDDEGRYTYSDGVFTLYWSDGGWIRGRVKIAADGSLSFHTVTGPDPRSRALDQGFLSAPWSRVGDPGR